ncbi:unnamed protein product [Schistosoma margrebowiei]|uniref:Uncharacterized protein n=1 Tax=Schistosoma margrebowiei TaxID=48269 RepID=A0A3P7XD03_9TREM|nr:unnamed protein product [Schistosoma margrebowiei]
MIHTPFDPLGSWILYAPLVWNQGFSTPLDRYSVSSNSVKVLDIRFSSSQFCKHPATTRKQ